MSEDIPNRKKSQNKQSLLSNIFIPNKNFNTKELFKLYTIVGIKLKAFKLHLHYYRVRDRFALPAGVGFFERPQSNAKFS